MQSNKKDEFLEAEKRASELIDTLEKLKKEMEQHAAATQSLSDVQSKLVDFLENDADFHLLTKEEQDKAFGIYKRYLHFAITDIHII